MNIALDISPLKTGHFLQHRVRGTGMYIHAIKEAFRHYFPQNTYTFFTKISEIPKTCEVIHIPYFEPFFLTLPFSNPHPTVVTVHDLTPLVFPQYFPRGLKGEIKWKIQKFLLGKTQGVIVDSLASKKDIIKYTKIPAEKIYVVYLAAGDEFKQISIEKKNAVIKKYNLPNRFVLYVGDVTFNKNLPRLLDAIKIINVPIVMVGEALINENADLNNPWNRDLRFVREEIKTSKNIICLGFVPREDLTALYNVASVFAMPSLYEGFGLPILEAMACGCPVLTSSQGSMPEIAGNAAVYVDAYNSGKIATAIKEIIDNNSLRQKLTLRGIENCKRFSWKKTAEKTIEVYQKASNT